MLVLKIGGSLISPKVTGGAFESAIARRFGRELAALGGEIVVAHGVGAVGRRALGPIDEHPIENPRTARRVRNTVGRLHRDLVESLREGRAPVEGIDPEELFVLRGGEIVDFDAGPLRAALRRDRIPVTYGCLVSDRKGGYSILSSDQIVEHCARALRPRRVLWATDVDGVLDPIGRPIQEIDPGDPPSAPDDPTDPTGGMGEKLGACIRLAAEGYESILFNGTDPSAFADAAAGRAPRGTRIPAVA